MTDLRPTIGSDSEAIASPAIRLGYVGIEVSDLRAWEEFAREGIGLHTEERDGFLIFRLDDHARRFILWEGQKDDVAWLGWEVDGTAELTAMTKRLESQDVHVRELEDVETAIRGVGQAIKFIGPAGLPFEIYCDPKTADEPLSLRGLTGFNAGPSGIGHIALLVPDVEQASAEIQSLMGASLTDRVQLDRGGYKTSIAFLHSNERHHSFAVAQTTAPWPVGMKSIAHIMIEVQSLEDVGAACIRCKMKGYRMPRDVGLHANDQSVSFYVAAPSAFQLEIAYGSVQIEDDDDWVVSTYDTDSHWGHKPFN